MTVTTDWKSLCEGLASYARLEWNHVEPEGFFKPLWYATVNEALAEDAQYHITQEEDGFWLTGELPDWVGRKVRYETLEAAQIAAHDHVMRYVLQRALEQIEHPNAHTEK